VEDKILKAIENLKEDFVTTQALKFKKMLANQTTTCYNKLKTL